MGGHLQNVLAKQKFRYPPFFPPAPQHYVSIGAVWRCSEIFDYFRMRGMVGLGGLLLIFLGFGISHTKKKTWKGGMMEGLV